MKQVLALAAAGAAGTLCRYWLHAAVHRVAGPAFPWGTMAVNIAGCFVFGLMWTLAEHRGVLSPETRTLVLVGFLGAFTTFSSYVFEAGQLLRGTQYALSAAYLAGSILLGLLGFFAGAALARLA